MKMDHVHVRAKSMARSNSTKMACEKATKRLRGTLCKATRLGVSSAEVAGLPSTKRLIPQRLDHGWRLAVFMVLMFGGGVVVALVCMAKNGCTRMEDIRLTSTK
ncbi:uncharacterized protein LOC135162128 isoform X3 [Diachasmimorpha longicaudata]|uniref:uncharacterized protein LOC135162128 isoform X3 n=1 Tax=Diachasmimorpha longicaudata TaxID=58733 RepID=UPI0030B869A7